MTALKDSEEISHNICIVPKRGRKGKRLVRVVKGAKALQHNGMAEEGERAKHPPEIEKLEELGREALEAEKQVERKYLSIIEHIRAHQLMPRMVADALGRAGWRKERISELKRVANASEEIFTDFKERLIGFKCALKKVREDGKQKTAESNALLRWRQLFGQFANLTKKFKKPAEQYFPSNGQNLFVWTDEQVHKSKTFTAGNYVIVVTKKEAKTDEKKGKSK